MLRGANKNREVYNRRVLDYLRTHSPAHADELNARGTARGWWDQVNYFRVMYKPVEACARVYATCHGSPPFFIRVKRRPSQPALLVVFSSSAAGPPCRDTSRTARRWWRPSRS